MSKVDFRQGDLVKVFVKVETKTTIPWVGFYRQLTSLLTSIYIFIKNLEDRYEN